MDEPIAVGGGELLSALVFPGRGACVTSLTDASGFEYLAQGLDLTKPVDPRDYAAGGLGGYDDCFPSVAPEDLAFGLPSPVADHGELWHRRWEVTHRIADTDADSVGLRCEVPEWGMRAERRVTVGANELQLDLLITNTGVRPVPFLWAGHLLLAVQPGSTLKLPDGYLTAAFNNLGLDAGSPVVASAFGTATVKPGSAAGDLRWGAFREGGYLKGFRPAPLEPSGRIELVHGSGRSLRLEGTIEGAPAPWLGVWMNRRGFPAGGEFEHLGVEFTTSPTDSLADAIATGSAKRLAPGQRFRATVQLTTAAEQ